MAGAEAPLWVASVSRMHGGGDRNLGNQTWPQGLEASSLLCEGTGFPGGGGCQSSGEEGPRWCDVFLVWCPLVRGPPPSSSLPQSLCTCWSLPTPLPPRAPRASLLPLLTSALVLDPGGSAPTALAVPT